MLYWYSHAHLLAHVVIILVLVLLLVRENLDLSCNLCEPFAHSLELLDELRTHFAGA